ncbi:kinase-like domain-containing protein [Zychaea mexicana]|uniref:kinase-like domain-containing protein n=1 Tax=Zychaea mexicana TaxID=64656 RepID=UPI0022FF036A|nr:kinase-like domain-containing protein [Zychaea mexicana]KAI9470417.1 kinase-like domain-containing protein [Zychaea mexicana]
MESSSTLSSVARFYNHNNPSSASMSSKVSKSSAWRKQQQQTEKILDIGKPTQFEHGIHVEYNRDNGRYMGLPDVWQNTSLPSDDILDTNYITPHLVPQSADSRRKYNISNSSSNHPNRHKSLKKSPSVIGKPYNIQHNVHVQIDTAGNGLIGLPEEWQRILTASGVPDEVVIAHPKTVENLMQVRMPDSLQAKQMLPDSPHSPHESRNSPDPNHRQKLPVGYAPPTRARSSKLLQLPNLTRNNSLTAPPPPTTTLATTPPPLVSDDALDDIIENADPNTVYDDFVLIAEGESGPMYAAKHIATNRLVAIKKISKTAKQKLSTIRNELTTMKMSRHPNVVEYIGCYSTEDEIWVVMECMDVSLADIIAVNMENESTDQIVREAIMARIARDLLRALCRIHRLHRIHRDIRSDNVLLNLRGEVKLSDFSHCAQLTKQQPKRNSIIGTPYWMAPEVIKGQEYDAKADIWSLGVLIMEMMQGDPPYVEYPPLRAVFLIASNGLPTLPEPDRWSTELKEFVQLCTMTEPADRPDADGLLKHPFLSNVANTEEMVALIEETRKLELLRKEDDEDEEECDNDDEDDDVDATVQNLAIIDP